MHAADFRLRVQQHQFVIAQKRHNAAALLQLQNEVQHAAAVWPAIDIVAQKARACHLLPAESPRRSRKAPRAAVNIANGNRASRHSVIHPLASSGGAAIG